MASLVLVPGTVREAVRLYMRDFIQFNALVDDEETPDSIIDLCVWLTISDFNTTAPLTNFPLASFPSLYLLHLGTVLQVMRSAGILQSRNRLNYSDGGITVATSDKAPEYMQWITLMINEYEGKKKVLKRSLNAASAYGGIFSEYSYVNYAGGFIGFLGLDSFEVLRRGFSSPALTGGGA